MEAKTVAKAKCPFCGVDIFLAEGGATLASQAEQATLHAEPYCERFLAADADEYAKLCKWKWTTPISEALDELLK